MEYNKLYAICVILTNFLVTVIALPVNRDAVVFPDDSRRQQKRLDDVITPPVLPVIPHLENDPSTLLANETGPRFRNANRNVESVKPRFGFSNGFDVLPNRDGGLTATFSNGFSGFGGNSQAAAHSFSVGFNQGFQASHSSSQSNSFSNNGLLSSAFSGSQASSQSSSFSGGLNGISAASAASSAAAGSAGGISASSANSQSAGFGGNGGSGGQSASSSFGFSNASPTNFGATNTGHNYGNHQHGNSNSGEGLLDIRHRGGNHRAATSIVFPGEVSQRNRVDRRLRPVSNGEDRWRSGAFNSGKGDDWIAILVSD